MDNAGPSMPSFTLMRATYHLKFLLLIISISFLTGCVKVESHQYYCDEETVHSTSLDEVKIGIAIIGSSNKRMDTMIYSSYHIGAPYQVKVFFDAPANYFTDFEVTQGLAKHDDNGPIRQTTFSQFETTFVHKDTKNDINPIESHVIELKPMLSTSKHRNFTLNLAGKIFSDGKPRAFTYACEIKYQQSTNNKLALVN